MSDIDPTETEAPPASPPAAPPRYLRDVDHRIVGGVSAGLSGATGVDVAIIRIAFVTTALLHGAGVLAYLAAWVAMPSTEEARSGRDLPERPVRLIAAAVLGALAVLVLVQPFAVELATFPVLLTVLLIGVGVALWRSGPARRARTFPSSSAPAGPPDDPATPGSPAGPPAPTRAGGREWGWRRREPGSRLGRFTIGALLLVVGLALVLDRAGAVHLTAGSGVALALVVLGGGLVVGTLFGHARWLALPVVLLAPLAFVFGTLDRMGLDAFGSTDGYHLVASGAAIAPRYSGGTGGVRLDLSEVDLRGASRDIAIASAIGPIEVLVPDGVAVAVDAETAVGPVWLQGARYSAGDGAQVHADMPGREGGGTLHLVLRAGFGSIDVKRPWGASPAKEVSPSPSPSPSGGG